MIIFVYGGKLKIEKSYLQVMNRFRKWLGDGHEEVHLPENMEPPQLNRYIGLFLLSLKRLDGNDMEPELNHQLPSCDRQVPRKIKFKIHEYRSRYSKST